MKFARYEVGGLTTYGVVENGTVTDIDGDIYGDVKKTSVRHNLEDVKLLMPCEPTKVLAVGLNYASHLGGRKQPEVPGIFFKTLTSLLDPEGTIILPKDAGLIEHEGELVIVIGRRTKSVSKENALDYVLGYTAGNDVSCRPWQRGDLQWWRAKGSDTFGPLGPFINTDIDPFNTNLAVRINGETAQEGNTSDLIFDVPTIISFISASMTLEPGDVIYTGTPGIPGSTKDGDTVEVEVEGVGVLRNYVADEK
jgi:2-keto-4-pentenoate hydratase/2-oxohepta-3-ene-1,7-dioic acid hydratase in catechol pathway